jgi:hypothetical protein
MYFGPADNFMLNARRAGPAVASPSNWWIVVSNPSRDVLESGSVKLDVNGAKLTVGFDVGSGEQGPVIGSIDGDHLTILWGSRTYTGRVSPDGRRVDGHMYVHPGPNDELATFTMVVQPAAKQQAGK